MNICVGARDSTLSHRQVSEVLIALRTYYPDVKFDPLFMKTHGDNKLELSLRPLDKTDFFTREIDELLLRKKCRIAVHSAKDLPDPLPEGITCIALTAGQTSIDSLVLREGEQVEKLPTQASIGSSSDRRDRVVHRLRPDLRCKDVRGTIEKRLELLTKGEIDGLVVAEAALVRLGLTSLNRLFLPGETAPLQGKLAIVARTGDVEMERLFAPLDTRERGEKKIWYTGLELPLSLKGKKGVFHSPLIEIHPKTKKIPEMMSAFADIDAYTHIIFTSKSAARIFVDRLNDFGYGVDGLTGKEIIAIGKSTASSLENRGIEVTATARLATQEGIIDLLRSRDMHEAYILLPQSARARLGLRNYLGLQGIRHQSCILYDTVAVFPRPLLPLASIDEIVFTSPSTVEAFLQFFTSFPKGKKITPIGPITAAYIESMQRGELSLLT